MKHRSPGGVAKLLALASLAALTMGAAPARVQGSFVLNGVDAPLKHVRAKQVELEKGKPGYVVLLSARPVEGDMDAWRTADPAEVGSFIFAMLESTGAVWVAEIGHSSAKSGRFAIVLELQSSEFSSAGGRVKGRLHTVREQRFIDKRYSIDLSFDVPLDR